MKPFSTTRYHELYQSLEAAVARRHKAELDLAELDAANDGSLARRLEREHRELADRFERQLADRHQTYLAERQQLEDRLQSETAAVRADYCRVVGRIDSETSARRDVIERKYQENCWMLSSIFDDNSQDSPQTQFERFREQTDRAREQLTAAWNEVEGLATQAVSLLAARRQRVTDEPDGVSPPQTRDEARQRFAVAEQSVRDGFVRLSRQFLPRLFAGWMPILTFVVCWAVWATIGYSLLVPHHFGLKMSDGLDWFLVAGAASLGACVIAGIVAFSLAARHTANDYVPLQRASVEAAACYFTWLKLADGELKRHERECRIRQASVEARRERSRRQFDEARGRLLVELESENRRGLADALASRDSSLATILAAHRQALHFADGRHRADSAALCTQFDEQAAALQDRFENQMSALSSERQAALGRCTEDWVASLSEAATVSAANVDESTRLYPGWDSFTEGTWKAPTDIPSGIRIGDYALDLSAIPEGVPAGAAKSAEGAPFLLPAVLPFPESPSLILKADGRGRDEAVSVLQTAALRLLLHLPPGDVRLTVIDPVGLGENFAAFMHLTDFDDLLISHRIWTESSQIDQQLSNLTEHMENVFQKYLRNEFSTLEEYNERAGEVAEPYRILVVANFPVNFSERAAQRLVSIATSGARCGVYTLVSVDTRQPLPRGFDLSNLEGASTVLEWRDGHFHNQVFGPAPLPLLSDAPPSAPLMAALIRKAGDLSRHIRRVEVPFHRISPPAEKLWTEDSRKKIETPLGRAGATKLQNFTLGIGTSQHALVAGKTGSGKSTLLNVVITNLALRYSPDEIEFYLIDFKKGVEFKTYAANRLPHARVISIESDREFGASVLERLDSILKERGDLFRQAGVQDIAAYRNSQPDQRMPRILLIVDEFQEFFVEDDRYAQSAALLLDRLVRQGRAFGMHLLLGSQWLGGGYSLARTTVGQMAVRVALQCSEADAHLILSEENSAARLLTRPGEAIYNDANGLVEGNNPFQIAWLNDDERDERLAQIREQADRQGGDWPDPIVFEGNVAADPLRNGVLTSLLESTLCDTTHFMAGDDSVSIWLGESVSLTGPTCVPFVRRSGANLLLVGQDQASLRGMILAGLAATTAQSRRNQEPEASLKACICSALNETGTRTFWEMSLAPLGESIRLIGADRVNDSMSELVSEIQRRQSDMVCASSIFFVIDDLSRFRGLKRSDDDFGFGSYDRNAAPTPAQQFATILRDGPAVGIHVIVACDSAGVVERWLGRQAVREFDMRVLFQMSAADSSNLIDSPAASRLGVNRALLHFEDRGTTEKFRPYGALSEAWKELVSRTLGGQAAELEEAADIDAWVVS